MCGRIPSYNASDKQAIKKSNCIYTKKKKSWWKTKKINNFFASSVEIIVAQKKLLCVLGFKEIKKGRRAWRCTVKCGGIVEDKVRAHIMSMNREVMNRAMDTDTEGARQIVERERIGCQPSAAVRKIYSPGGGQLLLPKRYENGRVGGGEGGHLEEFRGHRRRRQLHCTHRAPWAQNSIR